MEKKLKIEGMSCSHCSDHVMDALMDIQGVTDVMVNLKEKTAHVIATRDIPDDEFEKAIDDAGYELV